MVRRYARFGRLSLRKGEKEGEGLFRQKPVVLEPLTLVPLLKGRGDRAVQHKSRPSWLRDDFGRLVEAEGLNHLLPFGGSLSFCLYPPKLTINEY
jgi:hypothetical protein